MLLSELRAKAQQGTLTFAETIAFIEANYHYQPARLVNGEVVSEPGKNEGSCKIFAFARLNQLSEAETLQCFGDYYRVDVLQHPDAGDHANIRQFMKTGWAGIQFDAQPLTQR
ncbi:MAG TPA: HopJ type III effector protein [Pseudomonadales bacterium]|nr:HopJ type III effector protein [Pseudomonadales bacterium]